ncbi:MAG: thioredoxin family protein [Acidobacteriota bacterium]|jgi:thioredoxin 1|nr:thioredoxin family protein [Acidobacteriota bacterium]
MIALTSDTHDAALQAAETVVFDFSSPGCAPCRKVPDLMRQVIEELSPKEIRGFEIDVTRSPELAARYMVFSVPTLIVFHKGIETARFHALPSKAKLRSALE